MKQPEIEKAILQNLYEAYFRSESGYNMKNIRESGGWDESAFWMASDSLEHDGLIKAWAMGGYYRITSAGILFAEQKGIAPEEKKKHNGHARTLILDTLAKTHEEGGNMTSIHIESLSAKTDLDLNELVLHIKLLEDTGYVKSIASGFFIITYQGLEAVEDWIKRTAIQTDYEQISNLNPQARGRALQKILARVVEQHGWLQDEGVRTSNEEMDVIVFREREYYLVEAKWEKDPVQADVIREVNGKLNNRENVRGIIVSMSGFTEGAVEQAEDYSGQRIIMLFGPKDIQSMVNEDKSFDELLNAKYKEIITHRKAIFE